MLGFIEFVVFLFFYWLFYPRVRAMAEIIITKANEVFDHLLTATSSKDALKQKHIQQLGTIGTPRPTAYHNKVSRIMTDKALDRQIKRQRLANIKNIPRIISTSIHRPTISMCCQKCSPSTKTLMIETLRNFGARNFLQVDEELRPSPWYSRQFCHLKEILKLPNHDFPPIVPSVLREERLLSAIENAARLDANDSERNGCGDTRFAQSTNEESKFKSFFERHHKRAVNLLMSMRSTMSNNLLRFIAWVVYKLLPKLMPSCVGHPEQFEMLRRASETGLPLIFLPLHRSHIDYIVVTFILVMNRIKPPLVAAGDNLKIPFFGWLLRGLGAFYIKRRIDPVQGRRDLVYRAVLHTYMVESLKAGYNIEFFIEGGRTRTGKPCMPKAGLLSVIVDSYLDGTIEDALLVPVAINYDRLVEGNFVREQLGQPKKMESFTSAVAAIWKIFRSSYGMLRIDFNPPFSLKELMEKSQIQENGFTTNNKSYDKLHEVPSSTSLYGSDYVSTEQRQVVDRIARHIVYDSTHSMAVMSTNLLAYMLLYRYRNGATRETLISDMDFLRRELACKDCDLGFSGDSIDVIDHAVQVLGPALVRRDGDRITPVTLLPNVIELAYYANTMVSHLSLDAVVATVIGSLGAISGNNEFNEDDLIQNALDLCDILQYEFIFCRPCQNIKQAIYDELDSFMARGLIIRDCEDLSEDEIWSKKFASHLDSSDDEISSNKVEASLYTSSNMKEISSLQSCLSPFIDAYTVTALCLCGLVGRQVFERDLLQEILAETKNQFDLGISKFGESLSSDSIRGALKLFERWGVLECQHEGKNKLYYLKDTYDNDREIRQILDRIHKFKL